MSGGNGETPAVAQAEAGNASRTAQSGDRPILRGTGGRYLPNTRPGPGAPPARRVVEFRKAILESTSVDDMLSVWRALVKEALTGDVQAIREFFDRVIGREPLNVSLAGGGETDLRAVIVEVQRRLGFPAAPALSIAADAAPGLPVGGESLAGVGEGAAG